MDPPQLLPRKFLPYKKSLFLSSEAAKPQEEQADTLCDPAMGHGGSLSRGHHKGGQHRGSFWCWPIGSALPSWKEAFESTGISLKSSQGKVPGCRSQAGAVTACCSIKPGRQQRARAQRTMGNWLVNHWFSAAVLVSLWGWGLCRVVGCAGGLRGCGPWGLMGQMGADELPWGWAVGRDTHPLCLPSSYPGSQGRDGLGKPEVLGKTQLMGKGVLENLKMLLLCLATLAGSLPRASSPLVRGGGSCENSWQGEELAP